VQQVMRDDDLDTTKRDAIAFVRGSLVPQMDLVMASQECDLDRATRVGNENDDWGWVG
jgi:hypothetical protein